MVAAAVLVAFVAGLLAGMLIFDPPSKKWEYSDSGVRGSAELRLEAVIENLRELQEMLGYAGEWQKLAAVRPVTARIAQWKGEK